MKEQIQEYEAPDLSGIEEEIAVAKETIASQNTQIDAMRTLIESQETVLGQVRETINRVDGDQQTLFTDFRAVDKRLYELERDTGQELLEVRKSIREQIEEALANPLVGQ
jgi:septal ring factor EnvC (AmiA/AmiB activator)